jgi:hypothetical protein
MVKEAMEKAEARKLQPFYLRRFVVESLGRYGGELKERETGRYEIKHVPATVRRRHSIEGGRHPVLERYERVTFDRHHQHSIDKFPPWTRHSSIEFSNVRYEPRNRLKRKLNHETKHLSSEICRWDIAVISLGRRPTGWGQKCDQAK